MRTAALTLVLALLCTTTALAGGGAKANKGTLRVTNTSATQLAVVLVDPTQADLTFFQTVANQTSANFRARGGRILNVSGGVANNQQGISGPTTDFLNLSAGTHTVVVGFVDPNTGALVNNATVSQTVTVEAGKVKTVTISSNAGGGVVLASLFNDFGREIAFAGIGISGFLALGFAGVRFSRRRKS